MRVTQPKFAIALRETIVWATPRIDADSPRWCLRSEELRPPHGDWEENNPGVFNCPEYIQHVTNTRSRLLSNRLPDSNNSGQLLLVDYKITNHNEATEVESKGFFDWADNPPWDLWVCESEDKLICWIPSVFVDLVNRSMQVECMDLLHWVTSENARLGWHPEWMVDCTNGG